MTSKINIVILSTCIFSYEGLRRILSVERDINILSRITSLTCLSSLSIIPAIVLICPVILYRIGNNIIEEINRCYPEVKFIVYNIDPQEEKDTIIRLLRLGVKGIFYKDDDPFLLAKTIKKVYRGEIWVKREILLKLLHSGYRDINIHFERLKGLLTHREIEILWLISKGHNNKTIAEKLYISEHTVKFHLQKIFRKLNCKSRLEAALLVKEDMESPHKDTR